MPRPAFLCNDAQPLASMGLTCRRAESLPRICVRGTPFSERLLWTLIGSVVRSAIEATPRLLHAPRAASAADPNPCKRLFHLGIVHKNPVLLITELMAEISLVGGNRKAIKHSACEKNCQPLGR